MPDSYIQGKLASADTTAKIIVLLQSLGFREDFASTAALSAEAKLHKPPCHNLGTPESFLTAAHQFGSDRLGSGVREPAVSKHMQK